LGRDSWKDDVMNKQIEREYMKKEKTHWYDEGLHKTYGDDNNGLIWGIDYIDDDDQVIECEWFKTKQERNKKINE